MSKKLDDKGKSDGEKDDNSKQKNAKQKNAKQKNAKQKISYFQWVINTSGIILVLFLIAFLFGVFFSQCSNKNYVTNLSKIDSIDSYKTIDAISLESSTQFINNLQMINNNNNSIKKYLDKDISKQFNIINDSFTAFSTQIGTLYTLFNNSVMVISIILGIFAIFVALLGFYISKFIEFRYQEILELTNEIRISKKIVSTTSKKTLELNKLNIDFIKEIETKHQEINLSKETIDAMLNKILELNQEITEFIEKYDDKLYHRFQNIRVIKVIELLIKYPEKVSVFYDEILININEFPYEKLYQILMNYLKLYNDNTVIRNLLHLLILKDAEKFLEKPSNVNIMCDRLTSIGSSQLYYSPNDFYNIIIKLINYNITNEILDKYPKFMEKIRKFIIFLTTCHNTFEAMLVMLKQSNEIDSFITKTLTFSDTLYNEYIKKRKLYFQKSYTSTLFIERKKIYMHICQAVSNHN